jgi:LysR family transcriptional regulator, regulator of abg operon
MTFNQLRAFLAVADTQALRAAARLLNVSQPAVSKAMRELERQLGVCLFERHTNGVALTEYGHAFRRRASLLIEEMRRTQDEMDSIRTGSATRLSIAVSSALARSVLPAALARFRHTMPRAQVHFSEGVMPMALAQLRDGSVDFVATHVLPGMVGDEFEETHLFSASLVVCARKGHPLARTRRLKQLVDADWLAPGHVGENGDVLRHVFSLHGLPPPAQPLRCQSFTVALELVSQTDTLTVIAEPLGRSTLNALGVIALPLQDKMPSIAGVVITRKGAALTRSAQLFVECLLEVAKRGCVANGCGISGNCTLKTYSGQATTEDLHEVSWRGQE